MANRFFFVFFLIRHFDFRQSVRIPSQTLLRYSISGYPITSISSLLPNMASSLRSSGTLIFFRSLAFGLAQGTTYLCFSACIFVGGMEMRRSGVKYSDVLK